MAMHFCRTMPCLVCHPGLIPKYPRTYALFYALPDWKDDEWEEVYPELQDFYDGDLTSVLLPGSVKP